MFSIDILSNKIPKTICCSEKNKRGYGVIQIGDFKETILPLLSYWKPRDYKRHWIEAVRRILARRKSKAALIVDIPKPPYDKGNSALVWWPLYRVDEVVHIQNHLKSLRRFKMPFDSLEMYNYVHARQTDSEEGGHISEWTVSLKDMEDFLSRLTNT